MWHDDSSVRSTKLFYVFLIKENPKFILPALVQLQRIGLE